MSTPLSPARLLLVLVATLAVALTAAAPSPALTLKVPPVLNAQASVPVVGNLTGGAQSLLSGVLGETTKSVCQVSQNATLCTLQVLSYSVLTDHVTPTKQHVVKKTGGVVNVPTLIDASGDGVVDLSVHVQAIATSSIELEVKKLPTAPATMPLSVELLVNDPNTAGRIINVGYDARATTAPKAWVADAALTTGTTTTVDATMAFTEPPSSMTVLGGLFVEGPGGVRADPKQARLTYTPVPASSKLTFTIAPDAASGTTSAATPTKADLDLRVMTGADGKHVDATIDRLHQPVALRLDKVDAQGQPTDGTTGDPHVRLTTAQDVEQARLVYETIKEAQVVQRARLKAGPLPAVTDFTQTPEGLRADTSSPVDVEGGVATGDVVTPVGPALPLERDEPSYVHQDRTDGITATTFRVKGVEHVDVAKTGTDDEPKLRIGGRLASAPLHALITNDDGVRYDADIAKVPHNFSVALAFAQKRVLDFCGSASDHADPCSDAAQEQPAGIDVITLNPSQAPEPLFGRATHLEGRIDDVPSTLGVDVETQVPAPDAADQNTIVRLDTTRPIGHTLLRATDGQPAPEDPQDDGVVYVDQADRYALVAKISGFRRAHLETLPLQLDLRAASGHDLTFDVRQDDRRVQGALPDRPARTQASLTSGEGTPTVLTLKGATGAGAVAGHPRLELDLEQDDALFARATHLDAEVDDLPPSVAVTIDAEPTPTAGTKVHVDASHPIGRVLLRAHDGGGTPEPLPHDGLVYRDTEEQYAVVAQVHGFRRAHFSQGERLDLDLRADPRDFAVDVRQDARTITGFLGKRPAVTQASLTLTGAPTTLRVAGADEAGTPVTTPQVKLDVVQPGDPIFGDKATTLHANVHGIPSGLELTIDAKTGDGVDTEVDIAANKAIGRVLLRATDGTPAPEDPADNGLDYHDTDKGYAIVAKVDGFRRARLETVPDLRLLLSTEGGHDFDYDVRLPDLRASGALTDRPATTDARLTTGQPMTLRVLGKDGFGLPQGHPRMTLDLWRDDPIVRSASYITADVEGLPALTELEVDTESGDDGAFLGITANEPIGKVLFRAHEDPKKVPATPADNGVGFQDQADRPFAVVAKVDGFRQAFLDTDPKVHVMLSAAEGHDLSYDLRLPAKDDKPELALSGVAEDRPAVTHVRFDSADSGFLSAQVTGATTDGEPRPTKRATLKAEGLTGQVRFVDVELRDLPPVLGLVRQAPGAEGDIDLGVSTDGGTLGHAAVTLHNGELPKGYPMPGLPADGGGAIAVIKDDIFFVHARVKTLRKIALKTKPHLDAELDVAEPQDFRVFMDQGIGEDHTKNTDGCDDFEAEEHHGAHQERHDVRITPLQPGTRFTYRPGGTACKGHRLLEYTADGNADSISYETSAGDLALMKAHIGKSETSPYGVPKHLLACQAATDFCFEQIGRRQLCNLGEYCDTDNAHQSIFVEAFGEKTGLKLDVCLKNKDPQNHATCVRGESEKGIFADLLVSRLDAGYRYKSGFGFLSMNSQRKTFDGKEDIGPNQGVVGFVKYRNRYRAAQYLNLNFGYEKRDGVPRAGSIPTKFDNHYGIITFAAPLVGSRKGDVNCADPAYGAFFDSTQSWFHAVLHDDEGDLGDNLTNALCGAF